MVEKKMKSQENEAHILNSRLAPGHLSSHTAIEAAIIVGVGVLHVVCASLNGEMYNCTSGRARGGVPPPATVTTLGQSLCCGCGGEFLRTPCRGGCGCIVW